MSTDSGIPSAAQNQELAQDRNIHLLERLGQLKLEGPKGLVTLNGGAAIAMLAFSQALIGQGTLPFFKPFALLSLSLFLVGAFFAGIAFFFQYPYVLYSHYGHKCSKVWGWVYWGLLVASAIAGFIGGFVVVAGVKCAF